MVVFTHADFTYFTTIRQEFNTTTDNERVFPSRSVCVVPWASLIDVLQPGYSTLDTPSPYPIIEHMFYYRVEWVLALARCEWSVC